MKFLVYLLLLISLSLFGQSTKKSKLLIKTSECKVNDGFFWHSNDTLYLINLQDNSIAGAITAQRFKEQTYLFENLSISNYKLIYTNNYGQQINKTITISELDTSHLNICPDLLLSYNQNSLDKLKNNDSLVLVYTSKGCFHKFKSKIVIQKIDNSFKAFLYADIEKEKKEKGRIRVLTTKDSLMKTVMLTQENLEDFIKFENELNYVKYAFCTTNDNYLIKSKVLNVKKTDGSCEWHGYSFLRKSFFRED